MLRPLAITHQLSEHFTCLSAKTWGLNNKLFPHCIPVYSDSSGDLIDDLRYPRTLYTRFRCVNISNDVYDNVWILSCGII